MISRLKISITTIFLSDVRGDLVLSASSQVSQKNVRAWDGMGVPLAWLREQHSNVAVERASNLPSLGATVRQPVDQNFRNA